jgi:hypothetical protein
MAAKRDGPELADIELATEHGPTVVVPVGGSPRPGLSSLVSFELAARASILPLCFSSTFTDCSYN